jgi:hypothetical protein
MIGSNNLIMFQSDENDDGDEFFKQALPVPDLINVDLTLPPNTGEEYLYRVRLEASKCPDVVVATNIDSKKYDQKRSCLMVRLQTDWEVFES